MDTLKTDLLQLSGNYSTWGSSDIFDIHNENGCGKCFISLFGGYSKIKYLGIIVGIRN